MASLQERRPPAPLSTLVLCLVGAALVGTAILWNSWFVSASNRYGLRGAAFFNDELPDTLATAGNVTFFASIVALVCTLAFCLVDLAGRARTIVASLAGIAGIVAVCGAAYFISEAPSPAETRLGWCFPICLQGATILLIAALRPPRD